MSKTSSSSSSVSVSVLAPIQEKLVNSWVRQLNAETPQQLQKSRAVSGLPDTDDNRTKRPVYGGHYVLVQPTPLREPRLLLHSPQVAHELLHLTDEQVQSAEFLDWVSGGNHQNHLGESESETWATGYALSIMGTRYTSNCPFGTGDGYGDGRAISIAEFHGHELQLKGAGKTPYCRGADGRAVLRSSIREFLASEAVHHLGVPTTRALSVVTSRVDTVQRPWYSDGAKLVVPDLDDPRLSEHSVEDRRRLLAQLRNEKQDPNRMITEPCAITCRVSPSFCRIGHLDLFARRAERASMQNAETTNSRYDTTTNEWKELEQLVWHACFREYKQEAYDPFIDSADIAGAATALLEGAAERLSTMVAHWIRIGFSQGNFNADNCLVGGRTMDYGPFGFMEEYNPLFAKWTGSGPHFGFLNQPAAGYVNYNVLVESVVPVICAARNMQDPTDTLAYFQTRAQELFQSNLDRALADKMGLSKQQSQDAGKDLWRTLEPLLRVSRVDWTLFWRHLTNVAKQFPNFESTTTTNNDNDNDDSCEDMLTTLIGEGDSSPFYEPLSPEHREQYRNWIQQWRNVVVKDDDKEGVYERMRLANPKYVLREWMLVDAYVAAAEGDDDILKDMFELIQTPYDEGTPEQESLYYRRAHEDALTMGGTAFMSCSS
jgi:uncharacterized protein YdiU (UPF0061 family)